MASRFSAFASDRRANLLVTAALTLPFVALAAGFAVDFAQWRSQDSALKTVADSAAIAAARDMMIGASSREKVQSVAKAVVDANMAERSHWGPYDVVGRTIDNGKAVEVTLTQQRSAQFAGMVGVDPGASSVTSVARIVGETKICILALHTNSEGALELEDDAEVVAGGCSTYSNSTNPNGVRAEDTAKMTAGVICSAGGARIDDSAIVHPAPTTDCPVFPDPLATRPEPTVGACLSPSKMTLQSGVHVLNPGVYCGGIDLRGTASVTFAPGIYVMRGGRLTVRDDAQLNGRHVGIYFMNMNSGFEFLDRAVIDLGAPKDGQMAGILFWKERASMGSHRYVITTSHARMLIGSIYLPNGDLQIDTRMPVADNSPWTAIIARKINVEGRSRVVLNTDYDRTDVPVPATFDDKRNQRIYLSN